MDPKGTSDGVSGAAALATKYEHTHATCTHCLIMSPQRFTSNHTHTCRLGHVTIVQKGKLDVISDGHHGTHLGPNGARVRFHQPP